MNILYITNGINGSGGLERVLSIKTSYLADHYNYEICVLTLNEADINPFYEFSAKVAFHSIVVTGNPLKYLYQYTKKIQQLVNELQPDVISVCDDGLKGFFLPSLIKTSAKIIYERHASLKLNTSEANVKGKLMKWAMQMQVPKFDKFVVLTPSNVEEWKGNNIIVIPNPLSFKSIAENKLLQKRIIFVGGLSFNKGIDSLLEIWSLVLKEFVDWKLDIYGKKDAYGVFVELATEMELERITFYDPVKNIQEELETSSILVMTSRTEGFGMVLIEAMACNLPCVAFDCPVGPRDIIDNDINGFLVPPDHIEYFASKLKTLMSSASLRQEMGNRAKLSINRYDAPEIAMQWDKLFKSLIK